MMRTDNLLSLKIVPELYEADRLELIDFTKLHSEMMAVERQFINGLLRYYKPNRVLEVGVSRGAGTVTILNAILDLPNTNLVSIDRLEFFYGDKCTPVGSEAKTLFPDISDTKWKLYTGVDPSEVLPDLAGTFDFLVLDSQHAHPVESFNFLCALPYLNDGAIVIMHDISLYFHYLYSSAPRILMSAVAAEKLFVSKEYAPINVLGELAHNIVAFQIDKDTRRYIENVFHGLMYSWEIFLPDDVRLVRKLLVNHYPDELIKIFDRAFELNQACKKHIDNLIIGQCGHSGILHRGACMQFDSHTVGQYGYSGISHLEAVMQFFELKERIRALENSTSWRITKPIRAVKNIFNRIFGAI